MGKITLQRDPRVGRGGNFSVTVIQSRQIQPEIVGMQFPAAVIQILLPVGRSGDRQSPGGEHRRLTGHNITVTGGQRNIAGLSLAAGEINLATGERQGVHRHILPLRHQRLRRVDLQIPAVCLTAIRVYPGTEQAVVVTGQLVGLQSHVTGRQQHSAPVIQLAGEIQVEITTTGLDYLPVHVGE
ncbi:Uncharacterised protein [Yersinia ruckeri]|nr:Uncharacterised protein [Yersinia ruckeri]